MIESSGTEIDRSLFQKGNERVFGLVLQGVAALLETSNVAVEAYETHDPLAGMKEIEHEGGEDAEMLEELTDMLGEDIMSEVLSEKPPLTDGEYDKASSNLSEAETSLIDNVVGYQGYMRESLVAAYGQDDESVNEEAWIATWKKLKSLLGEAEGTLLAEATRFFDTLARKKFGKQYRPMEEDRGPAVNADTCARTFYMVMKNHLPRAIIGANRDEWTGYQ